MSANDLDAPISEQVVRAGSPAVQDVVDRIVGYRMSGHEPGTHAGLPSTTMTFIVSIDEPVTLDRLPDGRTGSTDFWALLGGLHDRPARIRHDGNQQGVQLDVSPLHARALFGAPAAAMSRQVVALDDVMGARGAELVERLAATTDWSERFEQLERVLRSRMDDVDRAERVTSVRGELCVAWTRLCEGSPVQTVADELGWSRRHLRTQFLAEFGLNPSTLSRIARFERAQRWIRSHPEDPLAVVAAWCGYSDQSHMSREFAELAGAAPRAWLRAEQFPFVHDDEGVAVPG